MLSSQSSAWQVQLPSGYQAAIDPAGDVVVSGVSYDGHQDRYTMTKLSGVDGMAVWQQEYPGGRADNRGGTEVNGYVYASRIDPAGDVVVAGKLGPDRAEWRAMKLRGTDGTEVWRWRAREWMVDAAIDGAGNVAASGGWSDRQGDGNLWAAKLDAATGTEQWYTEIGCNFTVGCGYVNAVTFDAAGDVIGAGYLLTDEPGATCFSPCGGTFCQAPCSAGLLVVKFRGSDGAELWRKVAFGSARDTWIASPGNAVEVASNGDVVAAGFVRNAGTQADMFVARFRGSDGSELWRWQTDGGGNEDETVGALAIDAAGDVVISGDLVHAAGDKVLAIAKLGGANGAELWRHEVAGDVVYPLPLHVLSFFQSRALAIDGNGDVLATGAAFHAASQRDWVIAKVAGSDGSEQWRHVIDGTSDYPARPSSDGDRGRSVGLDPTGAVISAGYTDNGGSDDNSESATTSFTVAKLAGEPISGRKVLVRDVEGAPDRRKLQAESRDAALFAPRRGSAEDPVLVGASLELFNPSTGESDVYNLPAQNWTGLGAPAGARGYRYKDNAQAAGPCKKVMLQTSKRSARLKVICGGSGIRFSLDEPAQGRLAVRLTFGAAARRHTMVFGGTIVSDAGAGAARRSIGSGGTGWFKAKDAPPMIE